MNFAILRKIRALPGIAPEKLINEIKSYITQARLPGMAEFAFYLSADDPQEFYAASFWWSLPQLQEGKEIAYRILLVRLVGKGNFLESYIFQLVWDFRRLPVVGQASVLRLLTMPENYPTEWTQNSIVATRRAVRSRTDIQAAWLGQAIDNHKYLLYRTDWSNLQAQQEYFTSIYIQNTIANYKANGVILNYASFDLRGIIKSDEMLEE